MHPSEPHPQPAAPSAIEPDDASRRRRDAVLARFLLEAPRLARGRDLGAATCAVRPWPHQLRVVRAAVERYPQSYLFCDEVGLGKTIEAGLALRQLRLAGRVRRALLLVPKAVLRQWQEELHEKLCLPVARLEGGRFLDVVGASAPPLAPREANPWNRHDLILASTQLARSRRHRDALLSAEPWDLVIVDEAHHARRRRAGDAGRPNRLLELLAGSGAGGQGAGLVDRTRCLYLLTATPMQVHPLEARDLLRLLGLGGRWGGSETDFLDYFEQLRRPFGERDWRLVAEMLGESLDEMSDGGSAGDGHPEPPPRIASVVRGLLAGRNPDPEELGADGRRQLDAYLRRATPVHRLVWRHTRTLLRQYRAAGLLDATVPERRPENVWIEMTPAERTLYRRIEDYLGRFYRRYEARRTGLGFVMTVYRRRLTSSFYAIERSLERRLAGLPGEGPAADRGAGDEVGSGEGAGVGLAPEFLGGPAVEGHGGQGDLFVSEGDDDGEPGGPRLPSGPRASPDERAFLEAFLDELRSLPIDSKLERLLAQLGPILEERDRVLIFTQYTDTLDHLREALAERVSVACYSGRGGEVLAERAPGDDGRSWRPEPKERLKAAFGRGEIQVLLCTEAASEGLNLQTCGVLINYDVPWNPMRVEQRIGRIDRIGQQHGEVWIYNYFYADTVEATVYERLGERIDGFREVIGELQPILRRVETTIRALAMVPAEKRSRATAASLDALDAAGSGGAPPSVFTADALSPAPRSVPGSPSERALPFDGDRADSPDRSLASAPLAPPADLRDVERILVGALASEGRFEAVPGDDGVYLLDGVRRLTFDPEVYDRYPYTVELVTWGTTLFDRLVSTLCPPEPGRLELADPAGLGLYQSRNPAPVSVFLAPSPLATNRPCGSGGAVEAGASIALDSMTPLDTLAELEECLAHPARRWSGQEESEASTLFSRQRQRLLRGMQAVEARRRRAERRAVVSGAVDLLVQTAHVELARAENPGLFDAPLDFGYGPEAVAAQARHGEPFATLVHLLEEHDIAAAVEREDPRLARLMGRGPSVLDRRFRELVERGRELAERWAAVEAAEQAHRSSRALRASASDPHVTGLLERRYFVVDELEESPWQPEPLELEAVRPFENAVPLFHSLDEAVHRLLAAAEEGYDPDGALRSRPRDSQWTGLGGRAIPDSGLFVAPVGTRALEPRWPAGAWVLFRLDPRPPRPGQPALFHHPDLVDPSTGELGLLRLFALGSTGKRRIRLEALGHDLDPLAVDEPEGLTVLAVPLEILGD